MGKRTKDSMAATPPHEAARIARVAPRGTVVAAALMLAACGLGMTAEQRVDKAREYMNGDNVPAAIIELKNALQEDPVNIEARLLLAEASFRAGDTETAVKEYERAIDLGAEPDTFRLDYAEALARTGRAERALEFADPAAVPGEAARAHWIRGLALTGLQRFDEAAAAFEAARPDADYVFAADIGRARLALAQDDADGARAVLDQLGAERESDSEYWEILAFTQLRDGDAAAAAESLRKAIQNVKEAFGMRRFMLRARWWKACIAMRASTRCRTTSCRAWSTSRATTSRRWPTPSRCSPSSRATRWATRWPGPPAWR